MKREVKIIGLSYSQSQPNSYVVVLSETNGHRKLPIIIKAQDAQTIALKLEALKMPRPTTHDVIKLLSDSYSIDCQEITIYQVLEGIFYAKMITHNGIDDCEIDITVGDALALSLTFECPLYATEEVLEICGVQTDDTGEVVPTNKKTRKKKENIVSVDDLRQLMNKAIENEEYEVAAELRDKISKIESEKK